jgi:hypothetical protein
MVIKVSIREEDKEIKEDTGIKEASWIKEAVADMPKTMMDIEIKEEVIDRAIEAGPLGQVAHALNAVKKDIGLKSAHLLDRAAVDIDLKKGLD